MIHEDRCFQLRLVQNQKDLKMKVHEARAVLQFVILKILNSFLYLVSGLRLSRANNR